ncbi:MAG: GNAT family N-acetyltransferase [Candidatus Cloacimonetes bacterium]|jgi:ribosomal protein S18 acetylase RimI-like enzyme|nr:GNAT family N-acetyltransferase [Candidatus Cloacimonadota bacterium]MDY0299286.1 GNAT family N-acetyltransferase [Candidatus Cloacimonadaceae bacterium]MCB5278425.1 GNAT family N-acetyltransferase [Candidatus Cloacimonadota bacterium]MCK9333406.1 GNAT family N-acetyltransferase [Candidatus Cloacimonadota bacterium]MDD2210679.1 GNAT family N-acetyltransferase [Candidatus Cloacimonadota bacterium]
MMTIDTIRNWESLEDKIGKDALIEFLHKHLDRFRDTKSAISKAIDYALSDDAGRGGYIISAHEDGILVGAVVMNNTGMQEFIPEYYLIYIAVDASQRGKGIGGKLLQKAFDTADGDIALHVEYDNPAKRLYERMGFTTKYAEMRWQRSK